MNNFNRETAPSRQEQFADFVQECLAFDGITDDGTAFDRDSRVN